MTEKKSNDSPCRSQYAAMRVLVFASLIVALVILVLYICVYSRAEYNSDSATNSLLAQAMFDEGSLYPRAWIVANGDFPLPSAAMLIAPLLFWLPNGFAAQAIVATLLALALMFAIACFLRAARMPWTVVMLVVMTLALGFSRTFLVITYLGTAYVWWPLAFFAMAALIVCHDLRAAEAAQGARALLGALFAVALLIDLKNPARVAVMVVLPVLVFNRAMAVYRTAEFCGRASPIRRIGPALAREIVILSALLTAYCIVQTLLATGVVIDRAAATNLTLTSFAGFRQHLWLFLSGWFEYLGAHEEAYANQILEPFLFAWRTAFVGMLTFVIVLELRDYKINKDPVRRALVLSFFAAFVPVLAIYLLFDPLAQDYVTARYFTLPYLILLALAGWRVRDALARKSSFNAALVVGFCLLSLTSGIQRMVLPDDVTARREWKPMQLAAVLQKEGLSHGYASWWSAGATTILSDSRVRVDPVMLSPTMIAPYAIMVDTRWYAEKSRAASNFIILTKEETGPEQRNLLRAQFGEEQREIVAADAHILVYDHDISEQFVCDDMRASNDAPLADGEFAKVEILSAETITASRPGDRLVLKLRLRNGAAMPVVSAGRYPVTLGIHLMDRQGRMLSGDFMHRNLGCAIGPQHEREIYLSLPQLASGEYRLVVDLVQEGYAWFASKGGKARTVDVVVP